MFNSKNPLKFPSNNKRATIKASVKQAVFKRANGQCEYPRCHKDLKWGNKGKGTAKGRFHHTRTPSITPTEKTVRFVCADHHDRLHQIKTVTKTNPLLGSTKERKIIRKDTKPRTRKSPKKRTRRKRSPSPDYSLI
jgi:hypothetical protein